MAQWTDQHGEGVAVLERSRDHTTALKNTAVTEDVWTSTDQIDIDLWDRVRQPSDLFMDVRLLRAVEISMRDSCRFRYVLYRNTHSEPVAIAVLCTFTIDIGVLANDAWSRWALGCFRKMSPKLVQYRITFCGLPVSACQSSLRFAPGTDGGPVLQQLDQTLRTIARQDRASVIVLKEFADEELPALASLESLGYRKADSLPTHHVAMNCSSLDGYLLGIGNKRRANIRRSIKKCDAGGVDFMVASDYETIERLFTEEVYRYYESVLGRSETQLEHLPRSFFLELAKNLPDACEVIFAMRDNRVLAFCITIWSGSTYHALFLGYDSASNPEVDLYFNLFYHTIDAAAKRGGKTVEFGQNSEYFKRTKLGALQSRRSIYVRGGNTVMNWIINALFKQLFPPRPLANETKDTLPEAAAA